MAKSKGLGDTVEKITTATGIKKVVDTVARKLKEIVDVNAEKIN